MSTSQPARARNTPVVLIIRDGWGENPHPEHEAFNAVKLARTPVDAQLRREWPWTLIKTSGEDVGLPEGTMGNSEVGHQNIGAGRIVDQEAVRITKACRGEGGGQLKQNRVLVDAISKARDGRREGGAGAYVHLMGLASDAGVHGLLEHLYALVRLCGHLKMARVAVHLFTDGRDTGPFTGMGFAERVEAELGKIGIGTIASVMGRYWAMDRDFRWERVERAYRCLTGRGAKEAGIGSAATVREAIQRYYDAPAGSSQQGDEFVTPTMVGATPEALCQTRITSGDTVVFYNYRGDRPREIVSAFVLPDAEWGAVKASPDTGRRGFDRGGKLGTEFVTMTAYSEALDPYVKVAFPKPARMEQIGGEYVSSLGMRQFRCAETEKYPHVTFFFNDYRDEPFPGERRENPQSPKVATYDLKPEMSAAEVRDAVLRRLSAPPPDCEELIVVNFANGDMVGHTGKLEAAIKACEVVDQCVGAIVEATLKRGGSLVVTADHGNAEQMWDPETKAPHTAHTVYDVPLFVVGTAFKGKRLRGDQDPAGWFRPEVRERRGRLADIFPTVLEMMGLEKPSAMTGESLLA